MELAQFHTKMNEGDSYRVQFFTNCLYILIGVMVFEAFSNVGVLKSMFLIDVFSVIISVGTLIALKKNYKFNLIAYLYALSWSLIFVAIWLFFGGINGPASYVFFSVLILNTIILVKRIILVFAMQLLVVCLLLSIFLPYGLSDFQDEIAVVSSDKMSYYYLLNASLIAMAIMFLKTKLDEERKLDLGTTTELTQLTNQLLSKKAMHSFQQSELALMKSSLEMSIKERTLELDYRHKQLEKYAYDNAHILRGPLCNIRGLVDMLAAERKAHDLAPYDMSEMIENIDKLDHLIGRINIILK
jgi:signal transduction histidine kinase